MGKASRKYRRDKERRQEEKKQQVQAETKRELTTRLKENFEAEEYGEALNILAEMIDQKIYDPDSMYRGAACYFMTGDYKRAISWLDNTLRFEPHHIAARLLLARICILEDRTQDGLAIYDFVLEHYEQALQPEQREDMQDILEYYVQQDKERVCRDFPYVAAFMHLAEQPQAAEKTASAAEATDTAQPVAEAQGADVTAGIRVQAAAKTAAVEVQAELPVQPQAPAASATEPARETKAESAGGEAAFDAAAKIAEVMAAGASVVERLKMLNAFAGGCFMADDYAGAKACLTAALQLDAHDDETLRNLAVLASAQGEAEKALQFASAMSYTDFALLQVLKG